MKKHLVNAAYGTLDYVSYPLGMLIVAPIVLHRLGAAEYGLWTIATSVASTGSIIASGFCDANIQRVARLRGTGDSALMCSTVRSMLGINITFGLVMAIAVWIAAPVGARHIVAAHPELLRECLISLRLASAIIILRVIESVGASTQRAFEVYRDNVQINAAVRLFTLGSAALLAFAGQRVVSILLATILFMLLGTGLQLRQAHKLLGSVSLWPVFQPQETRVLLRFGVFTWVQAFGSVIFGQLDRVILGVSLGAVAVAPYSLCVQFAHPIFGLTGSALQFLFPHLSRRVNSISNGELKRVLLKAFLCNLALVLCGAAFLLAVGVRLIELWAGHAVAQTAARILPAIVLGSSLMGLSVTGIYAMMALGLFRTVAVINLSARAGMLLMMLYFVHHFGLMGLAGARVAYGLFSLLLYVPLFRRLQENKATSEPAPPLLFSCDLQEASKS